MGYVVGVDIGGTFTDCVVIDDAGRVTIGKAPSTPPDFHTGFVDSIRSAATRLGVTLEQVVSEAHGIYHGCTVGTNALVEGRTAPVGLLTTRGHRDSLFAMQAGGRLRGLAPEYVAHVASQTKDAPLVPKRLVGEVDERITFDGEVLVPLNEQTCREEIERLLDAGAEAFAVSLLWSIINPDHERRIRDLVEHVAPGRFVSLSSEVIARSGEYERSVATVVNSLIGPAMSSYLAELERELQTVGYSGTLHIMTCSGGLIDATYARTLPVLTIGSGPVAGLIGAGILTRASCGAAEASVDVLTGDMGGTTFDVGVIREGEPLSRPSTRYGQYEYFVPTLDVRSIGAGGGSIIHFASSSCPPCRDSGGRAGGEAMLLVDLLQIRAWTDVAEGDVAVGGRWLRKAAAIALRPVTWSGGPRPSMASPGLGIPKKLTPRCATSPPAWKAPSSRRGRATSKPCATGTWTRSPPSPPNSRPWAPISWPPKHRRTRRSRRAGPPDRRRPTPPYAQSAGSSTTTAWAPSPRPCKVEARVRLTRAEREVTLLAATGHSNHAIAVKLGLPDRTAANHLQHAYKKPGIHGRSELGKALDIREDG